MSTEEAKDRASIAADQAKNAGKNAGRAAKAAAEPVVEAVADGAADVAEAAGVTEAPTRAKGLSLSVLTSDISIGVMATGVSLYSGYVAYSKFRQAFTQ